MKSNEYPVGTGTNRVTGEIRSVVSGEWVFNMVDRHGVPLDIVVMELEDRKLGFDVPNFVLCAQRAGWKNKRILAMLENTPNNNEIALQKIKAILDENS